MTGGRRMASGDTMADDRLRSLTGFRAVALIAVMLSGTPLIALVFSTIAPILPAIAGHFGPSGGIMLAQWVMTVPAIGLMLGGPAGGFLVDLLGASRLIVVSLVVFAFAGSAGMYVDDPSLLLVSRLMLGLSGACVGTASTWLIGACYDELARRKMIGVQNAVSGVATMGAVLISGWAAAAAGWRASFSIYLVALPLLVCALFAVPSLSRVRNAGVKAPPASTEGRGLLTIWPLYLTIVSIAGLMMMPATQVPFVLESNGVVDAVVRSRVIASSAFLSVVTAAFFPFIRGRVGERGTMLLILGFYAFGMATLAASRDALVAAIACMFMGSATGLFTPHFSNVIIGRVEPAIRGRAIGVMFGAIFLSEFISPLIVLPLRRIFGVHGGFWPLSAGLASALLLILLLRRRVPSRSSTTKPNSAQTIPTDLNTIGG